MKQAATTRSPELAKGAKAKPRRNRPLKAAETMKEWIRKDGLSPGDRLPQEPDLIRELKVSKSTVREALKVLETQGLVSNKTGPTGGAYVTEPGCDQTVALAANHLFFKEVTIAQVYDLRTELEAMVAREVATHVTDEQISSLRAAMSTYTRPPSSMTEEREQRIAELGFHEVLAGFSNNPLLAFVCTLMTKLLKELTVCKRIYNKPNIELRKKGVSYQEQLIQALVERDGARAQAIIRQHMRTARRIMLAQEARLEKGFLSLT